ncbi:hypothetical protein HDA32_001307 [Spinactinospora alkalitolerans]|uniref:Calpain catalytic domain-containing protein n=1 Tax=Spinactinospora alkalitolerans TaxID=687207 RepID=A0A852TSD9_9ACTN|nr:C2 family cysteine protease [Spinactinospora alkalitolerans]NYE46187.1 hypothetical protein [Spinactinospora alkalitolerans]
MALTRSLFPGGVGRAVVIVLTAAVLAVCGLVGAAPSAADATPCPGCGKAQRSTGAAEELKRTAPLAKLRELRDSGAARFQEPALHSVEGDPASGASGPPDARYAELDEYRLFAEGDDPVHWRHIRQQQIGDCWLMATMGAIAAADPGLIREMITANPNGTYTVAFPGARPVTVTPDLPLHDGKPVFAGSDPEQRVIWPAILEKAYAQREGGYGELENWHSGAAMSAFKPGSGLGDYLPSFLMNPLIRTDVDDLYARFAERGEAMTLSTSPLSGDRPLMREGELVSGHVYFVVAVDAAADTVTVRNPWGEHTGDIVLTEDEINRNITAIHSSLMREER